MRALGVLCLAVAASCSGLTSDFICDSDEDCVTTSGAGRCELSSRCSLPDSTCVDTGHRYTSFAGELSGLCTSVDDCFAQVRAGSTSTCALRSDNTVWCWGDGNATPVLHELPPGELAEIDVAGPNKCARYATGKVFCWEGRFNGEIAGLSSRNLAVGTEHACAVTDGDEVACWGSNTRGELGDGSTAPHSVPAIIPGLSGVLQVAVGGVPAVGAVPATYTTCAVTRTGEVWCWGDNNKSQLGNGFTVAEESLMPVKTLVLVDAVSVTVGNEFTCARVRSGAVYCWGHNNHGQLGSNAVLQEYDTPQLVPALGNVALVRSGGGHSIALRPDGTLRCWGTNGARQCAAAAPVDIDPPAVVDAAGLAFHDVDAGAEHNCARAAIDGAIYCWGRNVEGQVGNGTFDPAGTPSRVALECR